MIMIKKKKKEVFGGNFFNPMLTRVHPRHSFINSNFFLLIVIDNR